MTTEMTPERYRALGAVEGRLYWGYAHSEFFSAMNSPTYGWCAIRVIPSGISPDVFKQFLGERVIITGRVSYPAKAGPPICVEADRIEVIPEDADLPTTEDITGLFAGELP